MAEDYIPGFVPSAADKHYDKRLRDLYSLKNKLEAENAVMHGALIDIAHTETENSYGDAKDMPSGYYRAAARTALGLISGDHPADLLNAYKMRLALEHISGLRGYQGEDMGRVAGYRLAAEIAEEALKEQPGRKAVATMTAETIIAIRDALVLNNVEEAYFQLYKAIDPGFVKFEPWAEIENSVGDNKNG